MYTKEHLWPEVNIGSGNGSVPSRKEPLPESLLTQIYVTMLQWVNFPVDNFFMLLQYLLNPLNHIHICQMSL